MQHACISCSTPRCLICVGTRNEVNQEYVAQGMEGQYEHIYVLENMRTTSLETMRLASRLERGTGKDAKHQLPICSVYKVRLHN
jgi:hypothetical protein